MRKYKLMFLMFLCFVVIGCGKTNKINTITFRNGNETYQVEVKNGKITDKISTPTKDGYKFVGWYVDDKLYNFNDEITQDIVLTAKWEKIEDTTNKTVDEDNNKKNEENNSSNDEKKQSNENNNQSNNSNTNNNQQSNNQVKPQNTIKNIEENESIPFSTSTQNEVNMLRGTTQVIQNGENGVKVITYKVTYDSTGKEISREKVNEKVTKQPVNQITKIGVSDYNLNSDTYGFGIGLMCTKVSTLEDGSKDCIPEDGQTINEFRAIGLNSSIYYLTDVKNEGISGWPDSARISSKIKLEMDTTLSVRKAFYGGQQFYFLFRGGTESYNLTQEVCDTYNLACGRW